MFCFGGPDELYELLVLLADLYPRKATPGHDVPRHPRLLEAPALDDQLVGHSAWVRHGRSGGATVAVTRANAAVPQRDDVAKACAKTLANNAAA